MSDLIEFNGVRKVVFGKGAVNQICTECKVLSASRVVLVMDHYLFKSELSSS